MRKNIIIGSLLAVFLMVMLPSANAVESETIKDTLKSQHPIIIQDIDIEELRLKYQNNPAEPTLIILFILSIIINILRVVKFVALSILLLVIIIMRRISNSTAYIIS